MSENKVYSEIDRLKEINAELLEACKLAVLCMGGYSEMQGWNQQIKAAIRKAEEV